MKEYGITMTLPKNDTMRLAHLLGDHFNHTRWFKSAEKRDQFLFKYSGQHQFNRLGDLTRYEYECVERDI